MFHIDDLDVQRELSQIPPEYQEIFRQALDRELAELPAEEQSDTDVLRYLRRRRDDFRRGAFIRPDGRPGIVMADPEMLYKQGVIGLALGRGDEEAARERRVTRLKVAGFLLVAALFLAFALRGRAAGRAQGEAEATPVAAAAGEATPTPALPEMGGAGDALQTIGGLGAALTIGRPSAIELRYAATEEVIALAIDPSRPSPRGELRFSEATMASESPVAVWLFGTVVNYGIGLPDSLVRNLQPGDRIRLSTDTGASLAFVVTETQQGASHETSAVLSQNRPGMTLFALPAAADDDVALAFAGYDVASEQQQAQRLYRVGEPFSLPGWGEVEVEQVHYANTPDGSLRIVVLGKNHPSSPTTDQTLMLSLSGGGEQTPAIPLQAADGSWQATFTLTTATPGRPLFAELRALPGGALAVVALGDVPRLADALEVSVGQAYLQPAGEQIAVHVELRNAGEGAVYLDRGAVRVRPKGGDAYEPVGQVEPALPILIGPGETLGLTVAFPLLPARQTASVGQAPPAGQLPAAPLQQLLPAVVRLQIGASLWELSGLPTGDRQP
ncbi:MAG: hypothetical protein GX579_12000 [Chloroflexi bacterium]|nr:hypothetical protein [Chloroflexota bacterium]